MDSKRIRGQLAEECAASYLRMLGYELLGANQRHAGVEVDLLARDAETLVLVEVKMRRSRIVVAEDSLRRRQTQRLRRAAGVLCARHTWAERVRLDLVAIQLEAEGMQLRHHRGLRID